MDFVRSVKNIIRFTVNEIDMFVDLIMNYYDIHMSSDDMSDPRIACAHIFTYAHALDLIRCRTPENTQLQFQ
jgi:hypothetical protein